MSTRNTLLVLGAAALLWAAIVAWTGGFHVLVGGVPISSRDYRTALLVGLLALLVRAALEWRAGGWRAVAGEWLWLRDAVVARVTRTWRWLRAETAAVAAGALEREPWLALAPALAVAIAGTAAAVVQWADAPPLWLDEEMILLNVRDRSWSGLGGTLWLGQSAPLGWLAAERAVLLALGSGEAALRLVPLLFGIATIACALWIGHRWMTSLGSAVLVLLCAFGPYVTHHFFEAKHYSADTFWALLLPALAAWVLEGASPDTRMRRALAWWIAAAVGQALGNGALLVAPGGALVLVLSSWRRDGLRAAVGVAAGGFIFLAVLGAHYLVALRFTHESEFLREYWKNEIPPEGSGPLDVARWLAARFQPLADNPAGTRHWKTLWIVSALGLASATAPRRALALAFAAAPVTAFALAALRLVPLYERFTIWIVPALYVGIALALDAVVRAVRHAYRHRDWVPALAAVPLLAAAVAVSSDVFGRGIQDIAGARPSEHKHSLNDRYAVEWLMSRLRPGDALMTTRLGWPAVWWYGGISIANADGEGVIGHAGGVPLLQVEHAAPGPACDDDDSLREELEEYRRVLVYIGFRDVPPGFDYLLLDALDRIGAIKAFSRYSGLGLAAVIDLDDPSAADVTLPVVSPKTVEKREPLEGCARVGTARRW